MIRARFGSSQGPRASVRQHLQRASSSRRCVLELSIPPFSTEELVMSKTEVRFCERTSPENRNSRLPLSCVHATLLDFCSCCWRPTHWGKLGAAQWTIPQTSLSDG
jgi:hypothetical protein